MKTSVIGSLNMLGMAKRFNATILLASTSEIYGDPLVHPQPESYLGNVNSIGIRSCYDEGKRCAEALFSDYHRQYNLDIRIARLFNTYGPNMSPNDGRVISNFITQALYDNDITIYGDGQQTRSFCYVDDMVLGLRKLMNTAYTFPINLGNDSEFTITSLAQKILKFTNSRSVIRQSALPSDDPKLRRPDITLAKKIISWTPSVQLNEGLEKTIEYFRNHG
jgi:UDP-glucuronate decarboxylase